MKKVTLLVASLLLAFGASAQNTFLANPNGSDGNMTFIWDCEKNDFATDLPSNAYEIDQTMTFAVDITGTPLEQWVKEEAWTQPDRNGNVYRITRSIGIDFWTDFGMGGGDGRLAHIQGNIFGADLNFAQFFRLPAPMEGALITGTYTALYSNIFGFGFTDTEPGAEWWQLPMDVAVSFESAPYTGTKTDDVFYNDEYQPGLFPDNFGDWKGYTYPCTAPKGGSTGITTIVTDSEVIGYEYYNVLGAKLRVKPVSGIYIEKALKADGTTEARKVFKKLD